MHANECRPGQGAAMRWAPRIQNTTSIASSPARCTIEGAEGWLDVITLDAIEDLDLAALVMPAARHLANIRRAP